MSASRLLDRLDRVKPTGRGTWLACCPAHEDRSPSLSVRELDDGRTLVHCFSGCSAPEIVAAAGLELDALFPPRARTVTALPSERRPFPAADVLRATAHETLIVALVAGRIAAGEPVGAEACSRCALAVRRIQGAVDAALPDRDRRREFREAAMIALEAL